jgi:hypothetical protein
VDVPKPLVDIDGNLLPVRDWKGFFKKDRSAPASTVPVTDR